MTGKEIMLFPKATNEDKINGWKYNYEYLCKLRQFIDSSCSCDGSNVSLEQIDDILDIIEKVGTKL